MAMILALFSAEAKALEATGSDKYAGFHIVVAQDGSGDFTSIQEAINAAPDYSHETYTRIYIKAGIYREMVTIPHNKFRLHIVGEGADRTIISYGKYARQSWSETCTKGRSAIPGVIGTSGSATMYIHSSYVTLEGLTIENCAGEGKEIAQAVALFTDGDFICLRNCRLLGNQDTLYTYGRYGKDGGIKRNYYQNCYIEGTTDFIFGPSICYFENCTIHSKKNSYVTAASTLQGQKYGYVFRNCRLTADEGITKCYLGRPWGAYAKTVFIDCQMGAHILKEGWHNWEKPGKPDTEKNSYYAEYGSYGTGAAGKKDRVKWSYQLRKKDLKDYSFEKVMYQENDGIVWKPWETTPQVSLAVEMVNSEVARSGGDAARLDGLGGKLKWNYTTGLELKAMLDVWESRGGNDDSLFNYVESWYDRMIDEGGNILTYDIKKYNTDHVCPGRTLFQLYRITGKEKYKKAMDLLMRQLQEHPRTSEGGFWHKQVYPSQMWLDGLYMAQPFYAVYTAEFVEKDKQDECFKDIINHFEVVARHTYDPATRLYRHAWDESREMFWADKLSGQSAHAWGRALGWYCMALVDVLEWIPENVEGRDSLVGLLRGIYEVLPEYADPETGMWYQVLDCPGREGNYVEATCSAMFVYAALKGTRLGLLDEDLRPWAEELYGKLVRAFVTSSAEGWLDLRECCAVAGLGGKQMRAGDYDYYINEKKCDNDPKGVGPFIWASLEMEKIK
ncbi:MAG: pectinesterase family protein [Candidatus Cryptobacteroides sp.]